MIHQHRILIGALAALLISNPIVSQTTDGDDVIDCPLCADPTHFPQDPEARFVSGADTWTCQSAYDLGNLTLPADNCTFWQSRGEVICQCAEGPAETNECTLCEDGSSLPDPLLEVVPDRICAEIQVDAIRDEAELCVVYQQTLGVYCGCDNPEATSAGQEVCRLCGGTTPLPNPLTMVPVLSSTNEVVETSCVELEFAANLPGVGCSEFQQLYEEICCPEPVVDPEPEDGASSLVTSTWLGVSVFVLLSGLIVSQ